MKQINKFAKLYALLLLLQSTVLHAQFVKIPEGWTDGYAYANGIRIHYYHAVPAVTPAFRGLLPFPAAELSANPKLVQNPGY